MVEEFNKHLGNMLKMRRLALGLTQTKVAKAINVTFQQIQKYEKGINGVSAIRLMQLSNYLKVPINYFFDNYSDYLSNSNKSSSEYTLFNYNFLMKIYVFFRLFVKHLTKMASMRSSRQCQVGLLSQLACVHAI